MDCLDRAETLPGAHLLGLSRFDHLVDSSSHEGRLKDATVELITIEWASAIRVREDPPTSEPGRQGPQDLQQLVVDRDRDLRNTVTPTLPPFCLDDASPQVELLPLERELNATVEARVHRDHDLRPVFVTDGHVQPLLLALREVPDAAGRLGREEARAHGVADRWQALVFQGLDEVIE